MRLVKRPSGAGTSRYKALRGGRWFAAPLVASLVTGLLVSALVTRPAEPARAATVQSLQAQAAQIATELRVDGARLDALSQQYEDAQQALAAIQGQIAADQRQLAALSAQRSSEEATLRRQALDAYIEEGSGQSIDDIISSSANSIGLQEGYLRSATGDVTTTIANLRSTEDSVHAAQANLQVNEAKQTQTVNALAAERDAAQALESRLSATEASLKGRIATLVAQQQAAAAAAAAARYAAESRAAAAFVYSPPPISVAGSGQGAIAVRAAESYLGVPYVWGGTSRNGVDCSGLTMLSWEAAGVQLPRTAQEQYDATMHLSPYDPSQWEPGDLIFYGGSTSDIGHVALYIGGGEVIQALETGTVVQITSVFYAGQPVGVGRP